MDSIGIRELRQHASKYLERVKAGETIQITDRGRPIAVLSNVLEDPSDDPLETMIARGEATRAELEGRELPPPLPARPGFSASARLEEMRAHER